MIFTWFLIVSVAVNMGFWWYLMRWCRSLGKWHDALSQETEHLRTTQDETGEKK